MVPSSRLLWLVLLVAFPAAVVGALVPSLAPAGWIAAFFCFAIATLDAALGRVALGRVALVGISPVSMEPVRTYKGRQATVRVLFSNQSAKHPLRPLKHLPRHTERLLQFHVPVPRIVYRAEAAALFHGQLQGVAIGGAECRVDERIVGAEEEASRPFGAGQGFPEIAQFVHLREGGDFGEEVCVLRHHRGESVGVPLTGVCTGGGDVRDYHGDTELQGEVETLRVAEFIARAGEGTLLSGVREERELEFDEFPIEGNDALIGGVELHDAGNPFDEAAQPAQADDQELRPLIR